MALCRLTVSFENEDDKQETRNTASYVLTKLTIMLHPIMPFITEHLWQEIDFINDKSSNKIIHASWPKIDFENSMYQSQNIFQVNL